MTLFNVIVLGVLMFATGPRVQAQDPEQTQKSTHHQDIQKIQIEIAALEWKLQEIEKKADKPAVAFSAGLRGGYLGPYIRETTLRFNNVQLNRGQAYNAFTGIFTAPVKGIYYFTLSCFKHNNCIMNVYLYKDPGPIAVVYDHKSQSGGDSVTNGVTVLLEVGAQVYANLMESIHVIGSPLQTTFTGFLLFPM